MKNIKNNHCNINKRHEEINKNYLMDTEKAFKLEKRIELQHITFLRKKKAKTKVRKSCFKKEETY
jgi:hypothetical protein